MNILLAEDDTDDCIFFQNALEELPISTSLFIVRDGEQLMKFLREHANDLPDVLFLDISMPRKNGIECLSEIKEDEKLKHLKVVMFTISFPHNSDFEQEMKKMLKNLGAKDYIRKYKDFGQFKQSVHETLIKMAETKQPEELT